MATKLLFAVLMFGGLAGLVNQNELLRAERQPGLPIALMVEREALLAGINPSLTRALAENESRFNPDAVSAKGAIGVMQVMPFNAKACGLGVKELFDAEPNIKCGVKLFKEELERHAFNPDRAVQSYNGGPGCVNRCKESMEHSKKVMATMARDTK